MLKSIKIENFYSIGEKQELSFEISKSEALNDTSRDVNGNYINAVNCIIGANASGKTTVFNALSGLQASTNMGKTEENRAVVKVPDPRIDKLTEIYKPKKNCLRNHRIY